MSRWTRRGKRTTASVRPRPNVSSTRESVESFVLVFLTFLVLGVEAEGFVIPTGSMAPTLMGRHKEITCPQCGLVYDVDATREVEQGKGRHAPARVEASVCVNCRFPARIGDEPNFQGDRIYVMKTPLSVPFLPGLGSATLGRGDVVVFKLPEDPDVRYIKRLAGMPGETLRILQGDLWVRRGHGPGPFLRPVRQLKHQGAMQILVHDDAHRPRALAGDPRWARWSPRTPGVWTETSGQPGTYRTTGSDPGGGHGWAELRYRHLVPDPEQWAALVQGKALPRPPRATLITDFYAYNTDLTADASVHPWAASKSWRQPHWVGDLTVSFRMDVQALKGSVRVELVKAGVPNRCEIDLAADRVTLWHGDQKLGPPARAGLHGPGTYDLTFANVDDRLTLRLGDRLPFGDGVRYENAGGEVSPTVADLDPVGVGSKGAAVSVQNLLLKRDIYYTLKPGQTDFESVPGGEPLPGNPVALLDWLADPAEFTAFGRLGPRDFPIGPGRYMMLGDNSPWSRDGRDWDRNDQVDPDRPGRGWDDSGRERWEVPESLLIGKAFCVYWPNLKPFGPSIRMGRDVRLPARPYVERMRWVR